MKLKIVIALITTLGLIFGTVGIANAKTAIPLHKSVAHVTQHAKTSHSVIKKTSKAKSAAKATTIKPTAKKSAANITLKPTAKKSSYKSFHHSKA